MSERHPTAALRAPPAPSAAPRATPFYFGGLASCVATLCTHPLDLIKVRMQTAAQATGAGAAPAGARSGMLRTGLNVARNEGVLKLYSGLSAALLRQCTYSVVRFGAYDVFKEWVGGDTKQRPMSSWTKVVVAMAAGAAGGICGNPADVVNIRMQNDGKLPVDKRRHYRHAVDGLVRIVQGEGVGALWRGWRPNVGRAMLMTAGQLATYDVAKAWMLSTGYFRDNLTTHFGASLLAGLVATTICSPLDVVKTRVMNARPGEPTSMLAVARLTLANEGALAFMKGWLPSYARLGPHTIITFLVLEQMKARLL